MLPFATACNVSSVSRVGGTGLFKTRDLINPQPFLSWSAKPRIKKETVLGWIGNLFNDCYMHM